MNVEHEKTSEEYDTIKEKKAAKSRKRKMNQEKNKIGSEEIM
jgi:hypothetical protein